MSFLNFQNPDKILLKKADDFAFCPPGFGPVLARPHKSTLWSLLVIEGSLYLSMGPNRRERFKDHKVAQTLTG